VTRGGLVGENAQLALDTIARRPTRGIPSITLFVMQHAYIERIAGVRPGAYGRNPESVYLAMQRAAGTCLVDQWIPRNPLTLGDTGYEEDADTRNTPTTGAHEVVRDGMLIDSPEAVVDHMERHVFPGIRKAIGAFDEDARVREIVEGEAAVQRLLGPSILKSGYAFVHFPQLSYGAYGYAYYFMAYALYPQVMETHFSLQAELALLNNRAAARAVLEGGLPPLCRLDHDMADSRGTLVDVRSLDRLWFPHFARCLAPVLEAGVRLIWHCDGNLMQMVPRLLDVGICGFQGFQYEDGMDYERICTMRSKHGEGLIIVGGVSVTRTLPYGSPDDVRRELSWLVEHGPRTGLFLGASSSITPGVPWENVRALLDGIAFYRRHGRS
jgi:uroporphyrinogen decarboxylase-like protein